MQDTGPVLQRLQMEAYRAVLRAMAVAPLQYVSQPTSVLYEMLSLCNVCLHSCYRLFVAYTPHTGSSVLAYEHADGLLSCFQEQEKLLTNLRKELHVDVDKHTVSASVGQPPA